MFALPFAPAKSRASAHDMQNGIHEVNLSFHSSSLAGTSRSHGHYGEDPKKDKKRREIAGRLGREMSDKRDFTRQYTESMATLQNSAMQLATRPETSSAYMLRLYPLTLERSARLQQIAAEEDYAHEAVRIAYEEERDRVEEEWKKGRERVRERLLEGIEERRRRAREEKDGEGISDAALDSQSRPHITRKLRNKMGGTSPPPPAFPYSHGQGPPPLPTTVVPVPNPNSLSVDELPSPFPLPLTSSSLPNGYATGGGQRKRNKGGGVQPQALTGLGKAIQQLTASKELEVESDLGEIRRGSKRRRAAVTGVSQR